MNYKLNAGIFIPEAGIAMADSPPASFPGKEWITKTHPFPKQFLLTSYHSPYKNFLYFLEKKGILFPTRWYFFLDLIISIV
jgi:hypothetical protein